MLRVRPQSCPYCDHDVRDRLVCLYCWEPVPVAGSLEERGAWNSSYLPSERPLPPGVLRGGLSVLAATVAITWISPYGPFVVFAAPCLALAFMLLQPLVMKLVRQLRGERAPTRLADARALLASEEPPKVVRVRGRVRTELAASPFAPHAVWKGVGGRFFVETGDGRALVDDDALEIPSHEIVSDGDLVEICGPAHLVGEEVVFDGTRAEPLRARAL